MGRCDEMRKVSWTGWHKVCLAKEQGGFGIKYLVAFNVSLIRF